MPDIKFENYKHIAQCFFSICSLDNEQYKKVYGANLQKVLNNFDMFVENRNKHNPDLKISVNWLHYKFNENETLIAKEYFAKRNINFTIENYYAYINDGHATIKYFSEGVLEGYNLGQARKDIDFDRMEAILRNAPKNYRCPQKDALTINETGQVALCCVVTSKDTEYNLGDFYTLTPEEIVKMTENANICKICEHYNLPYFYHEGNFKGIETWKL